MAMDMIIMEKSDFDRLVGRIEEIAEHIRKSENKKLSGNKECWISNREAMSILGVSSRTLQRYRNSGRIPYFIIGKKCRYRRSDVEQALETCMVSGAEEKPDGLRRQYLVRTRKAEAQPRKA